MVEQLGLVPDTLDADLTLAGYNMNVTKLMQGMHTQMKK